MNCLDAYQDRIVSAEKAANAIEDNSNLVFGHAVSAPILVKNALWEQRERFTNVNIYHMLTLGEAKYTSEEAVGHFRHVTNFVGGNTREGVGKDNADFLPCFFCDVPGLFDSVYPVDIAIIQVSYPDAEGNCSLGLSCDYTKPASEKAKIVIAEMNSNMPHVGGDNFIHISKLDYIVISEEVLPEIPLPKIGDVEKEIGRHCASLIKNGATLQLGIGAIPDAVLLFLHDKKDLGIHTEMFSDGILGLVEEGVVNGKQKTLHPKKLISTFLMGTKKLYNFVNNNPDVELYPVNYINDPRVIAQNDNLVSINSCIEVDLMGQVVSETIGLKQFSGTGGQVDYVRGAAWSKGGISIMAMPSTAAKGTMSRIVPFIAHGAAITTPRNEVDYVITEFGIAKLKGKTLKERAKNLISIAHPNFKGMLEEEFNQRFHL